MQFLKSVALAFAVIAVAIAPVLAHSLEEVDQDLRDKDKYFQPVDSEAPGFTLQDAEGHIVSLASLRGKVVVLNFIYTNCPDVCPLHAERIAELQTMINQTPMKAMIEFVTITTDPKRDTGEVLRDYGKAHGLDPVNWVFLTATPDQPEDSTRKIAEAYGVASTPKPSQQELPVTNPAALPRQRVRSILNVDWLERAPEYAIHNIAFALTEFRSRSFHDTVRAIRNLAYQRVLSLPATSPVILTN